MNLIRRMVSNPVAANMLMIAVLAGGLVAALTIPRELFPEFSADAITVAVPYPGASPEDVERSICLKVEDRLSGMEDVKEISSTSREGIGTVMLELKTGADVQRVLDDAKSKVDQIEFPKDAEDPTVTEITLKRHVVNVAVAGRCPERTRKELAEEIREEINDLPEVSQVSATGIREYEITIEVSEEALRRHELTHEDVAAAVRANSLDLPAGDLETGGGEVSIRVTGRKDYAEQYKSIVVLAEPDGTVVRLADLATVSEGFEDVDIGGQFNGEPAAVVSVFKTSEEDSIAIAEAVRDYVERKQAEVPEGITLEVWSDSTKLIRDRLDMLLRNGTQGLLLVFLILWFFLGMRMSFWVALGIPLSILGTLAVLHVSGMTLNMMSMFALIMALGLIVDDAIVVGENIYSEVERGRLPRLAAIDGTQAVLLPVIAAVVTTWTAFVPLLFISGVMGRFIQILPLAVIVALAFSLLECLLILPPHLAHSLQARGRHRKEDLRRRGLPAPVRETMKAVRAGLDRAIQWVIDVPFTHLYRLATSHRYATLALFASVLVVMAGAVRGGHVPVVGFPKVESDTLQARITLPTGTAFQRTAEVARRISSSALELNDTYGTPDGEPVVQRVYSLLGQHQEEGESGSHLCEVTVELLPAEQRPSDLKSEKLVTAWRRNTGPIRDALSSEFGMFRGGPGGKALEIRLLGPNTSFLEPASERLQERLAEFEGVTDIRDDARPGKTEMKVNLRWGARNLGISLARLAAQLRDAFHGNESLTIQSGRDEIDVMVRYPEGERRSLADVETMRVRTPDGAEVPFTEVADVTLGRGYTTLRRAGRSSLITVSADVVEEKANAEQILNELSRAGGFFDQLQREYPGLKIDLRGQRQRIFESLDSLMLSFPVALLCIFTILATLFRSYLQPVIIMVAIPFGLTGAVVGHWLLGFDVTLLSMFGMVALTGIVVNDSLVLVDRVNREVRGGRPLFASAEEGARTRFRPIILTTLTTVAGITPMLFEQSFQAQFLKPMAVSIAFGLLFATTLTLLLVPSLYLIGNDLRRVVIWLVRGEWRAPEDVVPGENPLPEEALED